MRSTKLFVLTFLATDLLARGFGASTTLESNALLAKDPRVVDFCRLVASPESYKKAKVRTIATYSEGFEGRGLSRSDCPAGKNIRETVWGRFATAEIEFDCRKLNAGECLQLTKKVRQDLRGNPIDGASAEVQVVGWIEVLSPQRTQAGFNEAPIRFNIQQVENTAPSKSEP